MALSPTPHRFTVKDYHRMGEADIFEPDERVELLDGRREVVHVTTAGGTRMVASGDSVAPRAFPDLVIDVSAILP